jgi:hypothetical protein
MKYSEEIELTREEFIKLYSENIKPIDPDSCFKCGYIGRKLKLQKVLNKKIILKNE